VNQYVRSLAGLGFLVAIQVFAQEATTKPVARERPFAIKEVGTMPLPEADGELKGDSILPARRGASAAVVGEELFFAGGHIATGDPHNFSHESLLRSFDKWNPATGKAEHLPAFEHRGHFAAMTEWDGWVYKFGGFYSKDKEESNYDSYDEVERIDTKNPKGWEKLPNMPHARNQFGVVNLGKKAYIISGWNTRFIASLYSQENVGALFVEPVDIFNYETQRFEESPFKIPEGEGRRFFSALAWKNQIVIAGGFGSKPGQFLQTVWLFDPSTGDNAKAWKKIADLPVKMLFPVVISHKQKLYIVSAYDFKNHSPLAKCYVLADDMSAWIETDIAADPYTDRTAVRAGDDHWFLINGSSSRRTPSAVISEIK
jgi:N-acetylneuraminic acid mutarotase